MDAGGTTQTPFRTGTLIPQKLSGTRLCPFPGGSLRSVTGPWGRSRSGFFASVWVSSSGDRPGPLLWLLLSCLQAAPS